MQNAIKQFLQDFNKEAFPKLMLALAFMLVAGVHACLYAVGLMQTAVIGDVALYAPYTEQVLFSAAIALIWMLDIIIASLLYALWGWGYALGVVVFGFGALLLQWAKAHGLKRAGELSA